MKFGKYCCTGAHGTGKTTAGIEISNLLGIPFKGNISRKAESMGYTIAGKTTATTLDAQLYIMNAILLDLIGSNGYISDRSIIDCLAYSEELNPLVYELFINILEEFVNKYTAIFYFPIQFGIEDDGVRDIDIEYQKHIDGKIHRLLSYYKGRIYFVNQQTIPERVDFMSSIIKKDIESFNLLNINTNEKQPIINQ